MKKYVLMIGIILGLVCLEGAFATQITKVGIVDIVKVYSVYYKESKEVLKLEELRNTYMKEIQQKKDEILNLENEKVDAQNRGDQEKALELDKEIFEKKQFLNEYTRIKTQQLKQLAQNLANSNAFISEIADAIQYVAESEGFSLILKKSDQFLFWTPEIDITDKVIAELMKRTGKSYSGSE